RLDLRIVARTAVALAKRSGISAKGQATMAEFRPPAEVDSVAPATRPVAVGTTAVAAKEMKATTEPGRIWLSPPDVRAPERAAILAALDSGWVAPAGPDLVAFEVELAE